ncbi:GNAT family N-acetyltransferase [Paenibacillus guangzhouensis]|uniref:GNAT family N-acetyltransferase n=1 Tax=Paenibacillus guangzhouensis TaxID=1473112 RepID=UPI001266D46A|nr:GNAT family N-acetyltransferase [Paenibacillus guangzhouensis]
MEIVIRRMVVPDDYEDVARLINVIASEVVTAQDLADEDARIPAVGSLSRDEEGRLTGHDRPRWIAKDGEGRTIGYAHAWRAPWSSPGVLYEQVIVDPNARHQGVGRALFDVVMAYTSEVRADRVIVDLRDDDPVSLAFATKRGFKQERHLFESCIELANLDRESLDYPAFANDSFQMMSLADRPGEAMEQQLYELYRATHEDIPGFEGEYMWYSEWRKWTLDKEDFERSLALLVLDGDRPIGVVQLTANPESESLYNSFTGVDAAYRGQGIARALKIQSIREAIKRGYRYIRTNNDSLNAPMLRINRSLGYQPVPGYYMMTRNIE